MGIHICNADRDRVKSLAMAHVILQISQFHYLLTPDKQFTMPIVASPIINEIVASRHETWKYILKLLIQMFAFETFCFTEC